MTVEACLLASRFGFMVILSSCHLVILSRLGYSPASTWHRKPIGTGDFSATVKEKRHGSGEGTPGAEVFNRSGTHLRRFSAAGWLAGGPRVRGPGAPHFVVSH